MVFLMLIGLNVRVQIGIVAPLVCGLSIAGCSQQSYAPADRPYSASPVIKHVSWDFDGLIRKAPGSDLWPVTWASDGNLYLSWGDGGGFGGTNSDGRTSLGFARIEGTPEDFRAVNVWGGKISEHPAQFKGKSAGMISVDGTLYSFINLQNRPWPHPDVTIVWSEDLGQTWQRAPWVFTGSSGDFRPGTFLNFGRDNAGARDEYVYFYGHTIGDDNNVFMGRVPKVRLKHKSAYEFYVGSDEQRQPVWSLRTEKRRPCFHDPNRVHGFSVIYNEPLGRYLASSAHGNVARLGIFDATEPWGPWTTVAYHDQWAGYEDKKGQALIYSFPTAWISHDGKTLWMIYSANYPPDRALDSFNLVKTTLHLSE